MENHIREIITRAIIAKGSKKTTQTYTLTLDHEADEILGCWIIHHQYHSYIDGDKTKVEGSFDLHLWYAYDGRNASSAEMKTIHYVEDIDVQKNGTTHICANDETRCFCILEPRCMKAQVKEDGRIELVIEKELQLSVVGETTMKVESKDDLDFDIQTDFIS